MASLHKFVSRTLACAGLVALLGGAWAHDTWVMPANFRPPAGQPLAATISAGDGLKALTPPKRHRVRSLELVDAKGTRQAYQSWVNRKTVADIAFGAPSPGVSVLAYSTIDVDIKIKPKLVDDYLAEIQPGAAIDEAWARQRKRGETWKERYAKDAKTYLRSGDSAEGWPQLATLGQVLEIVPQQDPTRLAKGAKFEVLLQYKGQPLADIALRLFSGQSDEKLVRTDAQGRASFDLVNGGRQLIAGTLLNLPSGPGAPWTSRFVTLGFNVAD